MMLNKKMVNNMSNDDYNLGHQNNDELSVVMIDKSVIMIVIMVNK